MLSCFVSAKLRANFDGLTNAVDDRPCMDGTVKPSAVDRMAMAMAMAMKTMVMVVVVELIMLLSV